MQFQCGFLQYRQTDRQTHKTPCYLRVKDKSIDCMYRFSVYIGKTGLSGGRGHCIVNSFGNQSFITV